MRVIALFMSFVVIFPFTGQLQNEVLEPITSSNIDRIQQISELEDVQGLQFVLWTPNSEYFAVATSHEVRLYSSDDLLTEPTLIFENEQQITQIAFRGDFERMAVASGTRSDAKPILLNNTLSLVDLQSGLTIAEADLEQSVGAIAFSQDGTHLYTVSTDTFDFSIWDGESLDLIASYHTQQPGWPCMLSAVFNLNATLLALGSGCTYNDRTIWETETGNLVEGKDGYSAQLTFSHDSSMLAGTSRYGGGTELWYLEGDVQSPVAESDQHYVLAADFSHDDTLYAQIIAHITPSEQYVIQFANSRSGEEIHRVEIDKGASLNTGGMSMSFSPDGKYLLIYSEINGIFLWGVPSP